MHGVILMHRVCLCRYDLYVKALSEASVDTLEYVKEKALKAGYELLAAKPELEGQLLTIVVNKLGDPSRKVASKAGYLISCLLTQHPVMGLVVVREIEQFLFRCASACCRVCQLCYGNIKTCLRISCKWCLQESIDPGVSTGLLWELGVHRTPWEFTQGCRIGRMSLESVVGEWCRQGC